MPKAKLDNAYEILLDYGYIKPGVSDYDYWKALKTATLDFKEENNLEYFDVVRAEEKELRKKVVPKVKKKTITGAAFKKGTAQEVDEKVQADPIGTSSIVPFKKSPSVDSKSLDSGEEEPDLKSPDKDDNKVDQVLKFLKTDLVSKLNEILDGLNGIGASFKEQSEVTEERLEKQRLLMGTAKKRGREKELEKDDPKGESMGEKILKSAAKPVKGFLSTIWKFVSNIIAGAVFSFLLKVVKDPAILLDPIKKFFNSIIGLFNVVVKGLWDISAGPINMVIDGLNAGVEALLGAINKAIGLLGLKPIQPPTIPNIPGPPTVPTIPLSKTAQAETVETKAGGGEVGASDGADGAPGVDGADSTTVEKTSQSFTTSGGVEADQLKEQMADSRQDFNQDKPVQQFKEGGLVQPMKDGAEVLGSHSIGRDEDGGVNTTSTTGGVSGGGLDETTTTTHNKTITEADGTVTTFEEKQKMREQIASIGVPDLIEHKDQLLGEVHKLKGFDNVTIDQVINQQTGIPQKELLPILLRSDAQKATGDKQDKAHKEDLKARGIKPGQGYSISYDDEVGSSLAGTMGYRVGQTKPDQLVSSHTSFTTESKVKTGGAPLSDPLSDLSSSINASAKDDGTRNTGQLLFGNTQRGTNVSAQAMAGGGSVSGSGENGLLIPKKREKNPTNFLQPQGFSEGGTVPAQGPGYENSLVQPMAGGGTVDANNISAKEGGPIKNDSGVSVTGLGPDTQLVAAQPGEVVMSKKAVDHYGRDKLLQMNKEGGGTNENKVSTTNNIQPKAGGGEVQGKSVKSESGKIGGGLLNILKGGAMGMFAPQMMLLKPMLNAAESIAEKVIPQMGKAVDGTKNLILKHPAIGFAKLIFGEEKVNSWLGLTSSESKESSPSTQSDSISPSLKSSDISPPSTASKTNVITIPSPPQSSGGGGGSTPTSPNFSSVDPNNLSAIAVRPIYNLTGA